MPNRPRAILFDMDGTLIDTERTAGQALREVLAQWKIQLNEQDAHAVTGRKWEFAIDILFKRYGPAFRAEGISPTQLLIRVVDHHRAFLESLPELPLIAGSVQAVRALSQQLPVALVSGSQRREIEWAMGKAGVLNCFQFVMGAEDYQRSKPSPEGYLAALSRMQIKPEEALIFEDSEAGIASGLAAGARVIAVTGAGHAGSYAQKAHARIQDFTTPDWSDLPQALSHLSL